MWAFWGPHTETTRLTVHGQHDAALSCKGVICNRDLHIVRAIIREPEVVEEQGAIFEHQYPVSILGPQSPDDVSSNGLNHGDRLLALQLPLDDWQVRAKAAVVN